MMIRIAFMLATIAVARAQVPFLAQCPNVSVIENFELEKYLGKWYEIERYFAVFEFGGKCVTAEYTVNSNGTVTVYNTQISALTGIKSAIEGNAHPVGRVDEAKLSVRFPSLPFSFDAPYWVLETDYESYSVVWSCVDLGVFSLRNAWILTRDSTPSVETLKKAYDVIETKGIPRSYFIRTDQKNCPKKY